ncbi:hypothetical protein M426DRAFT_324103 [Hypoxylon sp. CI-4A]|nr:hypothetical protein M426DRAFT_324103 [Hypoxylon sp. CI-4A]
MEMDSLTQPLFGSVQLQYGLWNQRQRVLRRGRVIKMAFERKNEVKKRASKAVNDKRAPCSCRSIRNTQ